jgi:hypothetical protein
MKKLAFMGIAFVALSIASSRVWAACEDLQKEYQDEAITGSISSLAQTGALLGMGGTPGERLAAIQESQRQSSRASMELALRMKKKENTLDDCRRNSERDEAQDESWQNSMDRRESRY